MATYWWHKNMFLYYLHYYETSQNITPHIKIIHTIISLETTDHIHKLLFQVWISMHSLSFFQDFGSFAKNLGIFALYHKSWLFFQWDDYCILSYIFCAYLLFHIGKSVLWKLDIIELSLLFCFFDNSKNTEPHTSIFLKRRIPLIVIKDLHYLHNTHRVCLILYFRFPFDCD